MDFTLDGAGVLTFRNMAVDAQVTSAPAAYLGRWAKFDNRIGLAEPFTGEWKSPESRAQAPAALLADAEFLIAEIGAVHSAHPAWSHPLRVYFRRHENGWETVGLERIPDIPTNAVTSTR